MIENANVIENSKKTAARAANAKKKYAPRDRRSPRQPEREIMRLKRLRRQRTQSPRVRPKKKERPLTNKEKQALLLSISEERNPDVLKEKIELALRNGLEIAQKDMERFKKVEAAREHLSQRVREITGRQASADQKDAVQAIKTGQVDTAVHQLAESGRGGAPGNRVAEDSTRMAEDLKVISEETGVHKASVMQNMLFYNSAPIASINDRKDPEKKDRNLEGNKTKDSTTKQVYNEYLKRARGAAAQGA